MLKLPDGRIRLLVQGLARARIDSFLAEEPYLKAKVTRLEEPGSMKELPPEHEALLRFQRDRDAGRLSLDHEDVAGVHLGEPQHGVHHFHRRGLVGHVGRAQDRGGHRRLLRAADVRDTARGDDGQKNHTASCCYSEVIHD